MNYKNQFLSLEKSFNPRSNFKHSYVINRLAKVLDYADFDISCLQSKNELLKHENSKLKTSQSFSETQISRLKQVIKEQKDSIIVGRVIIVLMGILCLLTAAVVLR